jgi:hypothetical protein
MAAKHRERRKKKSGKAPADSQLMSRPLQPPKLGLIDPAPGIGETIVTGASSYLGDWWKRHHPIVKAFADDLLLYAFFLGFVRLMKYLFQVSDSSGDLERHHQLHDWGFLICDATILCGFIRKVIILIARH